MLVNQKQINKSNLKDIFKIVSEFDANMQSTFHENDNWEMLVASIHNSFRHDRYKAFIKKWKQSNSIFDVSYSAIHFKIVSELATVFSKNTSLNLDDINLKQYGGDSMSSYLKLVFINLKVDSYIPITFLNNIHLWEEEELQLVVHLLNGNSPRTFPELFLSKKENTIFLNTPDFDVMKKSHSNLLQAYTVYCKLIKSNTINDTFFYSYFENGIKISHDNQAIINPIEFFTYWNLCYKLLSKWKYSDKTVSVDSIIDYLHHMSNYQTTVLLKGRTAKSMTVLVNKWHQELFFMDEIEYEDKNWKGVEIENKSIITNNSEYTFTQITDGHRLALESTNLQHCVLSYLENCLSGRSSIWNMHQKSVSDDLTLEIKNKNIVQALGFENRYPTPIENEIIQQWANENELEFLEY